MYQQYSIVCIILLASIGFVIYFYQYSHSHIGRFIIRSSWSHDVVVERVQLCSAMLFLLAIAWVVILFINIPLTKHNSNASKCPTSHPSRQPSILPFRKPSKQPQMGPSIQPTRQPIKRPTKQPIRKPSIQPTRQPIKRPTKQPVRKPSNQPTLKPSKKPSTCPSNQPNQSPTNFPTRLPSR